MEAVNSHSVILLRKQLTVTSQTKSSVMKNLYLIKPAQGAFGPLWDSTGRRRESPVAAGSWANESFCMNRKY